MKSNKLQINQTSISNTLHEAWVGKYLRIRIPGTGHDVIAEGICVEVINKPAEGISAFVDNSKSLGLSQMFNPFVKYILQVSLEFKGKVTTEELPLSATVYVLSETPDYAKE